MKKNRTAKKKVNRKPVAPSPRTIKVNRGGTRL